MLERLARSLTTGKVETRLLGWRLFELGNNGLGRWDDGQDGPLHDGFLATPFNLNRLLAQIISSSDRTIGGGEGGLNTFFSEPGVRSLRRS